jgi:ubiquinone/menaquinone biosynthesis C-methylase UbiE
MNSINILEAGCGSGRVYFHYKKQGENIKAFDYSKVAVDNILKAVPDADVVHADITNMPYDDESFNVLLALGVFHGIEDMDTILKGLHECKRVLTGNGNLLFSVRLNSLENDIIDHRTKTIYTQKYGPTAFDSFHKWQFDPDDVTAMCDKAGLKIEKMQYVRNVSFLFKWEFFKNKKYKSKVFNEYKARSTGFKLNVLGSIIDKLLHKFIPRHFSNTIVITATKKMTKEIL